MLATVREYRFYAFATHSGCQCPVRPGTTDNCRPRASARPPDGGTDYNQLLNPDIDAGKPLKMTVPATSYYRDRCIPAGDYKLYVALLQSNEWPPWPSAAGDYSWGAVQEPLRLQSGQQQFIDMEILLEPYSE